MPKSFSFWPPNTPGAAVRLLVVLLLAANLVALFLIVRPPGGSPEELRQQLAEMRVQLRQRQGALDRTKRLVSKIESGRTEGDEFLDEYFLPKRTAYAEILAELTKDAAESKVTAKETSFALQDIEGSDTLQMMQISANFEARYGDLIHFINMLDRSDNLLIIEGLSATPEQGSGLLNVTLKLDTFVREDTLPGAGAAQ